jgi:hypothetical protein
MNASRRNVSTENQPKGSACNLSDTLDRQNEQVAGGQRQWADDSAAEPEAMETDVAQNASVRAGGEAAGGIAAQAGDPTSPAAANARSGTDDDEQAANDFGDDGPRSNRQR